MDKTIAISLHLAKDYLKKLLPENILENTNEIFNQADSIIANDKNLSLYVEKVHETSWGDPFSFPSVDPELLKIVTEALYKQKRIWAYYKKRTQVKSDPKKYYINPLGLVYNSNIAYLVCTLWESKKIFHLALHRMYEPQIAPVEVETPKDFVLKEYVNSGAFQYQQNSVSNEKEINFRAILSKNAAIYFEERPNRNQTIKEVNEKQVEVNVKIADSWDLRHTLRGFGNEIQVLEPKILREEIHKQALYDGLTQLLNRAEFDFQIESEMARHKRSQQPFSLLFMDIDKFKSVNDTYGHSDGDEVLKEFAKRLKNSIRDIDASFRYGGEEFAVLLPETDIFETIKVAQRIRLTISDTQFSLPNSHTNIKVTVSIGVAAKDMSYFLLIDGLVHLFY